MRTNRALLLLLLCTSLLITACEATALGHQEGLSSSTAAPFLPTATFTIVPTPTAAGTPAGSHAPTPASTPAATTLPQDDPALAAVEIVRGNAERPWIALTFNSGTDPGPTASILDTLREKDVHCTMFLTPGDWVRTNAELVRRMVAEGHELGNHSYSHAHFPQLSDEQIARELSALEETVLQVTGRSTKPYCRPPYGDRDDRVLQVVQENGYLNIYWTYHVRDWFPDETPESVFRYTVDGACNGAIVVMHLGSWQTAAALPSIIDELQARGYSLVTLSELLAP